MRRIKTKDTQRHNRQTYNKSQQRSNVLYMALTMQNIRKDNFYKKIKKQICCLTAWQILTVNRNPDCCIDYRFGINAGEVNFLMRSY